jgi:hypothetical protein
VVAEEGEGVVDGGGSGWVLGVVGWSLDLAPCVLNAGHAGGWVGKVIALVVEHHGPLGFVLAMAIRWDGREAMRVG